MKLFPVVSVLAGAVASVLGQTIELGYPTDGTVLSLGQNFTAQVIQPVSTHHEVHHESTDQSGWFQESMASCIQVGIALAMDSCTNGVCPQPANELGDVLYAGPWTPTPHNPGGFYQNFTFQVSQYMSTGPAIFTLTHLCLLGVCYFASLFSSVR